MERNLAGAPVPKVVADARRLPFCEASVDYVFCSMLLHHFPDGEVVALLRAFRTIARKALLVIDLQRSPAAERFLPATRWLFGWHRVTLHDGPVSVRAAFRRAELSRLGGGAGLDQMRVRSHQPWFRLSLVARSTYDA
jgi:hypothetical protein